MAKNATRLSIQPNTCCLPKMVCPGTLLKNPDLDIGKKL